MCGEQPYMNQFQNPYQGSPPRVRGTVSKYYITAMENRITPACAGNSLRAYGAYKGKKDHPRVCGEQLLFSSFVIPQFGSPPRVRGTELFLPLQAIPGWITPACAGNSSTVEVTGGAQ